MKISAKRLAFAVATLVVVPLAISAAGFARGGPPHPPGEEEEGAVNNLSVPALFVPDTGGSPFTGDCATTVAPTGDKGVLVDGVLEHPDYYIQGVEGVTWQAGCAPAAVGSLTVGAEWGDNLGSAPLKQGTPIRVEIGFLADPATNAFPGYDVVKLDPTLLDRESHYGTLGNEVSPYPEVRVWSSGVTLNIKNNTDGTQVYSGDYSAEVNSTGRVVYGFNWQQPVAGAYTITVNAPGITVGSTDVGTIVDEHTVTLGVNVGNKGGGGSGGGGQGGGGHGGGGGGGPNR